MNRIKRLIFSWFGKQSFYLQRKNQWWCEKLHMWEENPWQTPTRSLSKYDWSSGRWTRSKRAAFKDFEESIDLGIDCTMEHDAVLFNKRIALWDYRSVEQEGFGSKK